MIAPKPGNFSITQGSIVFLKVPETHFLYGRPVVVCNRVFTSTMSITVTTCTSRSQRSGIITSLAYPDTGELVGGYETTYIPMTNFYTFPVYMIASTLGVLRYDLVKRMHAYISQHFGLSDEPLSSIARRDSDSSSEINTSDILNTMQESSKKGERQFISPGHHRANVSTTNRGRNIITNQINPITDVAEPELEVIENTSNIEEKEEMNAPEVSHQTIRITSAEDAIKAFSDDDKINLLLNRVGKGYSVVCEGISYEVGTYQMAWRIREAFIASEEFISIVKSIPKRLNGSTRNFAFLGSLARAVFFTRINRETSTLSERYYTERMFELIHTYALTNEELRVLSNKSWVTNGNTIYNLTVKAG